MAEIISAITSVFTSAIGWVGTVAEYCAGQPITAAGLCGRSHVLGVGMFKRLLSAKA